MAINAIYATSIVGLSPSQFGFGLGVSAAVALALSTPTGHLADRIGPRSVQIWSFVALGPLTALLLLVDDFDQYVLVISLQAVAYSASRSARMAMVAGLVPPEERVRTRALLRVTSNVSVSVGAALAGVLLIVDTEMAYRWALVFNAATYAIAGLFSVLLPSVPRQAARPGPRLEILRDRPYLTFIVLDGLLSMHYLLLDVVLPLWVVHRTHAPRSMIAVILLLNTISVVLLQVRTARGTDDPEVAARASRLGALCLGLACVVFALSAYGSALLASALLVLGALLHVMGEVRQAAGSWGISFGLAPDHAQGQYQGTYAMGADIAKLIAPAALTWLAIQHETVGWLTIALGFVAVGLSVPLVVAWANRCRPAKTPLRA